MTTTSDSETLRFIAKQLLDLNEKVGRLESNVNTVAGGQILQNENIDRTLDAVISMQQTLSGVVELGKTAFDMAEKTKEELAKLTIKLKGGEDDHSELAAAHTQ